MNIPPQRLEDYVAFRVHRLSAHVLRRFEKSLLDHGVTHAQWLVMFVIYQEISNVPKGIAEVVGIDPGAISRIVDRLVIKKLINKHPHHEDKRSITIKFTTKGKALMNELIEIANEQEAAWLTPLSHAERQQFEATLDKLLAAQAEGRP